MLSVSQLRSHRSIELPDRRTLVAAKVWVSPYPIALVIIHTNASRGTANAWHFYCVLVFVVTLLCGKLVVALACPLSGRYAVSVAKELGISAQQIRNWKRQFTRLSDKQFNTLDGVDYSKKESEELRALRRENKRLKDEMEFLKKVSAYFAKQQE
ncbi:MULTISPECIES: transposase [unclassified Vibrio]|nr:MULTISPECIES: transposase [unclassified Vibrio]